jgi:5-formyltetrahydrofolate cyclo-ligase
LIERARARHCQLYVPHIVNARRRQMQFVLLPPDAPLQRHRWGMPQLRQPGRVISIRQLDLVLAPTVAFDAGGHRLGMGAGFYDRHLACLHQHRWRRPRLIGVALALQQVAQVPVLAHDVPLPWVMTERGLLRCHSSAS